MKDYTVTLRGSVKNNTDTIEVQFINCTNKHQVMSLAYSFFEKGETNIVYGSTEPNFDGLSTLHRWLPEMESLKKYAGKYKVYLSQIKPTNK